MTIEEKKQAILECVNSKKISGNRLDKVNKGKTISKLRQGKNVTDEMIERIYNNMQTLLNDNQVDNQVSPSNNIDIVVDDEPIQISHKEFINKLAGIHEDKEHDEKELETMRKDVDRIIKENDEIFVFIELLKDGINKQFDKLQSQIDILKEENQALKNKLDNQVSQSNNQVDNQVSQSNNQVNDNDKITVNDIVFLIRKEIQSAKVKLVDGNIKQVEYEKLYAKRRIAGKLHRIYLGDNIDKDKAIAKIQAYIEKHNLKGV